ncbi:MAG TPA: MBL fold metallo-hydrolase [Clostridia bacterium]|nr:MBL fold metallo-hydrolase [Clostridia bacterium]
MKTGFKIAGICLLAAVISIIARIYIPDKFIDSTGDTIAAEADMSVNNTDMSVNATDKSNNETSITKEKVFMSYNSIPIMQGVWEITDGTADSPSFVDVYLIEGTEKALLIDAGVSGDYLRDYVKTLTGKPVELVLTHGHGDHIAAISQFKTVFMSSNDFDLLKPYTPFDDFESSGYKDIRGGETFDLGGCKLEVIALPGHTPGSVVLLDRERQFLFAGDAIGSGSLWMQLPESSTVEEFRDEMQKFGKSLEALTELKPYLGHNCLMGRKPDKDYITDTRIAAEKIVSGELTGVPTDRKDFPGAVTVSYGQMTDFLYRPEKIMKKGE